MPRFLPDPDEITERLFRIIKPPIPPWLLQRFIEERELRGGDPPRRRRPPEVTGSRMIWPYVIEWKTSISGRGTIKVLRDEKTLGKVSYIDKAERDKLIGLLDNIIRGGG